MDIDNISKNLPPDTQKLIRYAWQSLSKAERDNFTSLLGKIPSDTNLLRMLINMSSVQFRQTFGQKRRIAILGPANVGKSTLYNQLVSSKGDKAEVGALPGTTREAQEADAGLFTIVDTPGADAVGEVGEREQALALAAAEEADIIVILFDAIQGIKRTELDLYQQLVNLKRPYVVVMNKIDLVQKESQRVIRQAAINLRLAPEQIIPTAAKSGKNLSQVLVAIASAEPEIVAALGHAMPAYRWQLAWRAIVSAASISAAISLTPLPVIDFAPLIVTQSVMVLGIARIYDYRITLARARELVAAFGFGLLGRTLFHQLSKLGGPPGWLLAAAIAASTTVVMGYAAVAWFERGEKLSGDSIRRMTREMTRYFLENLRDFGKRKPGRKSLQQRIAQSLENAPLPHEPSTSDAKTKQE